MRRLSLAVLLVSLTLTACGDAEDPVVIDTDQTVVERAPDSDTAQDAVVDVEEPVVDATLDAAPDPAPSAPVADAPAAPTPALKAEDPPAETPAATATALSPVTFFNNTGMAISHLYVAGCDESEGNDWDDMKSWAQERLEGDALDPDESTVIQYAAGCYVVEPHYVGGSPISEKVMVDGPTAVDFTIG